VQGDFSAPERAKIEKLLGSWTYQQPPVPPFPESTQRQTGHLRCRQNGRDPDELFAWSFRRRVERQDYPALEVDGGYTGGGFKSRSVPGGFGPSLATPTKWRGWGPATITPVSHDFRQHEVCQHADTLVAIQGEVQRIRRRRSPPNELDAAKPDRDQTAFVFTSKRLRDPEPAAHISLLRLS